MELDRRAACVRTRTDRTFTSCFARHGAGPILTSIHATSSRSTTLVWGSQPPGGAIFLTRAYRWLHNVASQATGLGITTNIIDCYAAIFECGSLATAYFSSASVGAPTRRAAWPPSSRIAAFQPKTQMALRSIATLATTTRIAEEAVKKVYQHVSSPKDTEFVEQRKVLANRFRAKYGCDNDGVPNAAPFFIGVFDTVASLGSYVLSAVLLSGLVAALALVSALQSFIFFPFLPTFLSACAAAGVCVGIGYVAAHIKYATGLKDFRFGRPCTGPRLRWSFTTFI